uniref:Uncharacterized protein n=1 Tax=Arundo donax TaxID=35708 RepID=A0A0A9EGR4_ARUDO
MVSLLRCLKNGGGVY